MVTKHNHQQWPYEPQVMTDDEAENAYIRLLEQEDESKDGPGALGWIIYAVILVLSVWGLWAAVSVYVQVWGRL